MEEDVSLGLKLEPKKHHIAESLAVA